MVRSVCAADSWLEGANNAALAAPGRSSGWGIQVPEPRSNPLYTIPTVHPTGRVYSSATVPEVLPAKGLTEAGWEQNHPRPAEHGRLRSATRPPEPHRRALASQNRGLRCIWTPDARPHTPLSCWFSQRGQASDNRAVVLRTSQRPMNAGGVSGPIPLSLRGTTRLEGLVPVVPTTRSHRDFTVSGYELMG